MSWTVRTPLAIFSIADRLRTHYPEVFAAMERDEYQSVHAAAVDAGIRKKMVQHIATVAGFAKAACKYLTPDERTQLIQKLL